MATKTRQKTQQLQLRVSRAQKLAIRKQAQRAGMSMSDWVLSTLLPSAQSRFQLLLAELASSDAPGYVFAELLELLGPLKADELELAVAEAPGVALAPYWANYVAATVEHAAARKRVAAPAWTQSVAPLAEPVFGSALASLRLHLLVNSPPPFIQRNIFIDSNVGDRV